MKDLYGSRILTRKEQRVVALLARGLKNKEIAEIINTTELTVKNYIRKIFDKLGMHNRVEVALWYAANSKEEISMGYELFTREFVRFTTPRISLTNNGRLSINKSASEIFNSTKNAFAHLYWDRALRKVKVQLIEKEDEATYKLKIYGKGETGIQCHAATFLRFISYVFDKTRSFPAEVSAGSIVFTIPEDYQIQKVIKENKK